jgi:tripartite-type tricarboxylate transporter receptor subunit TctC
VNEATDELAKAGRLAQLGQEPVTESPDVFARYIADDFKHSEALLKKAGFKPI